MLRASSSSHKVILATIYAKPQPEKGPTEDFRTEVETVTFVLILSRPSGEKLPRFLFCGSSSERNEESPDFKCQAENTLVQICCVL